MIMGLIARSLDRGAIAFLVTLAVIGILVPVLNLFVPVTSPFVVSMEPSSTVRPGIPGESAQKFVPLMLPWP